MAVAVARVAKSGSWARWAPIHGQWTPRYLDRSPHISASVPVSGGSLIWGSAFILWSSVTGARGIWGVAPYWRDHVISHLWCSANKKLPQTQTREKTWVRRDQGAHYTLAADGDTIQRVLTPHSGGRFIQMAVCGGAGELSYEMKSGTWESLGTIHRVSWSPTIRLCLTITHEPVSRVTNFYINCHLIEADNLQLYLAWEKF